MAEVVVRLVRNRLAVTHISLLLMLLLAHGARAHDGGIVTPTELWHHWSLSPGVIVPLALAAGLYGRGLLALRRWHAGAQGMRRWQSAAFFGGLAAVAVALVSPLDALSSALFAAHMAQHLLLVMVAAPLLAFGLSPFPIFRGLPASWRTPVARWLRQSWLQAMWRALTKPLPVWILHVAVLWLWHLPDPYQAAVENEALHALEHASFLGTATLYWMTLVRPRAQAAYGLGVLSIFLMATQSSLLGALFSLASAPWYAVYGERVVAWGLTPLEDQQLAGLLMWLPGNVIYVLSAGAVLTSWLAAIEREVTAREAQRDRPARRTQTLASVNDPAAVALEEGVNR